MVSFQVVLTIPTHSGFFLFTFLRFSSLFRIQVNFSAFYACSSLCYRFCNFWSSFSQVHKSDSKPKWSSPSWKLAFKRQKTSGWHIHATFFYFRFGFVVILDDAWVFPFFWVLLLFVDVVFTCGFAVYLMVLSFTSVSDLLLCLWSYSLWSHSLRYVFGFWFLSLFWLHVLVCSDFLLQWNYQWQYYLWLLNYGCYSLVQIFHRVQFVRLFSRLVFNGHCFWVLFP